MFDSMREHYESVASRWEIARERFAGEEINEEWEEYDFHDQEEDDVAGISLSAMYPDEVLCPEEPDECPF